MRNNTFALSAAADVIFPSPVAVGVVAVAVGGRGSSKWCLHSQSRGQERERAAAKQGSIGARNICVLTG